MVSGFCRIDARTSGPTRQRGNHIFFALAAARRQRTVPCAFMPVLCGSHPKIFDDVGPERRRQTGPESLSIDTRTEIVNA